MFIVKGEVKVVTFADLNGGKWVDKFFGDQVWMPGDPPKATAFIDEAKAKKHATREEAEQYIIDARKTYVHTQNFRVIAL